MRDRTPIATPFVANHGNIRASFLARGIRMRNRDKIRENHGKMPASPQRAGSRTAMPLSFMSWTSSPDWNISRVMSQPPTNSPFT